MCWSAECHDSCDKLKQPLQSAPILAYPDMNKPFMLTCDASKTAISFVLGQLDNRGREHVIDYGGRSLSEAEQIWSTTEHECLDVLEGIKQFRTYLSRRFKIYTNHKTLKYFMDQKVVVGKLGRCALKLQDFDFEIIHKPGKNNQAADALIRRTYTEVEDESISSESICYRHCGKVLVESETIEVELFDCEYPVLAPLHPEVLQSKWQNVDHDFQNMHAYLSSYVLADEEEVKRKTVAEAQYFSLCDCVLYKWFPKRFKTKSISNRYVFQWFCDMMY